MKPYQIEMSITVKDTALTYNEVNVIKFSVSEKLPANVDAEKYLKQRLAEEIKRHFGQLVEEIDNKTEEHKESADPLQ